MKPGKSINNSAGFPQKIPDYEKYSVLSRKSASLTDF